MKKKLSVIVPCYNEQDALKCFYDEINKVSKKMKVLDFELIFIDDGSKDKTLEIIKTISKKDKRVRYISLSRNFGKEAAMLAGLEYCEGDFVAIMDADLQDPPYLLEEMYSLIVEEGYDCVAARRINRKGESILRSLFVKLFYKMSKLFFKNEMVEGARDYRLMKRVMVNAIISMKEYNRYSKGIFNFVGFKTKWLEYENIKRVAGKTKWSFWELLVYAFEGIISFSIIPLRFSTILCFLFGITAFIIVIIMVIKNLIIGKFMTWELGLLCIMSAIQLFSIGVIGQYLSKAYLEIKQRPVYIVRETEKQ